MNWTKLSAALASFVTVLAMMPYELGQIATVFPPAWKPYLTVIGALATVFLRLYNSNEKPPTPPSDLPPNR